MPRYAVWALGVDQPGIVAAVTGALLGSDTNLADCSMTILDGQFAMVLIVDAPESVDVGMVERALEGPRTDFGLVLAVRPINADGVEPHGDRFVLTVRGADRPGIVHHVAAALATQGVNISDLTTRVMGDADTPLYLMLVDITVPGATDLDALRAAVSALAVDLDVEATLHAVEGDPA